MAQPLEKETTSKVQDARSAYTTHTKKRDFAANTNYAPTYPTISGDWNAEQYDNRNLFGVTNVEATSSGNQAQTVPGQRRRRRLSRSEGNEEMDSESGSDRRSRLTSYKRRKQREVVKDSIKEGLQDHTWLGGLTGNKDIKVKAKKAAAPVLNLVIAGTWTSVFLVAASWFGIIFLFLLFGTMIIEELLWGMTIESLRFGLGVCYGLQVVCSAIVILGILGQLKITGVHALGGKGGAVKQMVFILTILPMFIPGGPFFIPWYTPWLIVIGRYPR